ncbi:MAG: DUF547 domain-containing protein [Alphaproteobacteria bacterium]|nr:DUF547 domain-containing protein [Alphaproteobacteria bacterium]
MKIKWAMPLVLAVGVSAVALSPAAYAGSDYQQFSEYSEKEVIQVSYHDWSYILKTTVFEGGMSDRSYAPPPTPGVGRKVYKGNSSPTRYEGNRLYFMAFMEDSNQKAIHRIRRELEAMPGAVPMAEWTKNQQLAYWLNLYNITVVEQIGKAYPETNIRSLLYGRKGILDKKLLTVAGEKLSLNDIHHKILIPNWNDPLIMYGLFHGYVGSPNIRKEAYTARNVYQMLRENAAEFINSNRGMVRDGDNLRVAELYQINKALFPDWNKDLKAHLEAFATADYVPAIRRAGKVRAKTEDYYIADLYQGVTHDDNPFAASSAVFAEMGNEMQQFTDSRGAPIVASKFPPHVLDYVMKIRTKKSRKEGTVGVEEYVEPAPTASDTAATPEG